MKPIGLTPSFRGTLFAFVLAMIPTVSAQDENADARRNPNADNRHSILVTGAAEVFAAPDQAVVRFGMTAQNSRASVAQSKVNEVIEKAITAIQKPGINRQSIHTARISLTPLYSDKMLSSGASKISTFRADNVIEVTVEDIKLIGEVIDAAVAAGANEVQGVSFRMKGEREYRFNALTIASQDANAKAKAIANALGVKLGAVIQADETGALIPLTIESAGPSFMGMAPRRQSPTVVEPGQIQITANVTVRYEISANPGR